jgi:hypothetical protein
VEAVVSRLLRFLLVLPVAAVQFVFVAVFLTLLCTLAAAWSAARTIQAGLRTPVRLWHIPTGIAAIEQHLAEETPW